MKEKIRKHYHWLVAIIALLSYIVFGGLTNNLSSMFILPVTEELGISRSAFSVAISLRSMITFVINLFFGFLYRRFGYRKLAICGFAGMAVFLFAMGLATGYGGILCAIPAMGLFGVFCDTANLLQLIRNWFHRHQGMVIGMVTAASGIGGALFSLMFDFFIQHYNWHIAIWAASAFHLLVGVLVVLFLFTLPKDKGLVPLGEEEELKARRHRHIVKQMSKWRGLPLHELQRKPMLYLSLAATFLDGVCCYATFYIVVPLLQDNGLSSTFAASMQSTMLLSMAGTKFLFGALSDRVSIRRIVLAALVCTGIGTFLLPSATSAGLAVTCMVLLAIGLPLTSILAPMIASNICGTLTSDFTTGWFLSMISLSAMVTQPLMNICYDTFGSYNPFVYGAAGLTVLVFGLYLVIFRMSDKERKKPAS